MLATIISGQWMIADCVFGSRVVLEQWGQSVVEQQTQPLLPALGILKFSTHSAVLHMSLET